MSISTAITDLLDAKADLKHNQEINALDKYIKLSTAIVKDREKILVDEVDLLVTRRVGGLIKLIGEAIK